MNAKLKPFDYIKREIIETEYGVTGMVRERQRMKQGDHTRMKILGVSLCIGSVIPLLGCTFLEESELWVSLTVPLLLILCSAGVFVLIRWIWIVLITFTKVRFIHVHCR